MNKFISILALMLTTVLCDAQSFRGLVVDENQVPLEFVTVSVSCDSDSTFMIGGMTDSLGNFDIQLPRNDMYIVNVSYMEYKTFSVSSAPCDLGKIVMIPDEYKLGEIVVAGHRPILKAVAGGKWNVLLEGKDLFHTMRDAPFKIKGIRSLRHYFDPAIG